MASSRAFHTSQDVSDLFHDIEKDVQPPVVTSRDQWPPVSDDSMHAGPSFVTQRPRVRLPNEPGSLRAPIQAAHFKEQRPSLLKPDLHATPATVSRRPRVRLPLERPLATVKSFRQKGPFLTTRGRDIVLESPKLFGSH